MGGVWLMTPMNCGSKASMAAADGRASDVAITRPSESSVSVSSPHLTVNRYDFAPSWTIETVLVASPKAIGRTPEASGSSVPAWPAFLALNSQRNCETACVEVTPTGLSRQTQPLTSTREERRCPRGLASSPVARVRGSCSIIILVRNFKITRDARRMEKLVDPRLRIIAIVEDEAQIGRKFQIDAMRDLSPQRLLIALQRRERRLPRLAAERHEGNRRQTQVRRHFHLADRKRTGGKRRLLEMAARQRLHGGVANQFGDAQKALRRAGGLMVWTRHRLFQPNQVTAN